MFYPKSVGATELSTSRTSVTDNVRCTSRATEVKTKGGIANYTFDQTLRGPFHHHICTTSRKPPLKREARIGHIL